MKKKFLTFLFLIITVLSLSITVYAAAGTVFLSDYTQVVYDDTNGLPTSSVNTMIQSSDGMIWLATYRGLVRYNGKEFTSFTPSTTPSISSNSVMSLFEDSFQRLWLGTNDNGMMYLENNSFIEVDIPDEIAANSIQAFAELNGVIFIGAKNGLFKYENNEVQRIKTNVLDGKVIEQLMVDSENRLWVLTESGSITILQNEEPIQLAVLDDLNPHKLLSMFQSEAGTYYFGSEEAQLLTWEEGYSTHDMIDTQGLSFINSFCEDRNGIIWMCSGGHGLGVLKNGSQFTLLESEKITNSMEHIMEDYEGNIWSCSSRSGLLQLIPNVFGDLSVAGGLKQETVNSAIRYDDVLYIATDSGVVALNSDYTQIETPLPSLLSGSRTRALFEDSQGNLWVATYENHGVVCLEPNGELTKYTEENSEILSNKTRAVMERSNGDIVIATGKGINIIRDKKIIESYGEPQGLTNSVILSFSETESGNLLIGTDGGGLFSLDHGSIMPVNISSQLDSQVILRLYHDKDNGLWISTGASLYYFNNNKLDKLSHISDALGSVFDIIPDENNKLWILATSGIIVGEKEQLIVSEDITKNTSIQVFNKDNLMPYQMTANSWNRIDDHGNLLLCGNRGLSQVNINNYDEELPLPKVKIESIEADGTPLDGLDNFELTSNCKRLTIKISSPTFSHKTNASYQYQLVGFDDQMQSSTDVSEISYTNLKGGNYSFSVQVLGADGSSSAVQTISFSKAYKPLERPSEQIILIILLILIAAFIIKILLNRRDLRFKQLEHQKALAEYNSLLEQKVKEKTLQISQQQKAIIAIVVDLIGKRDGYTQKHINRTQKLFAILATEAINSGVEFEFPLTMVEDLAMVSQLHDLGKIGIPDTILLKKDKLTPQEFETIKLHTTQGSNSISRALLDYEDNQLLVYAQQMAKSHHEKWDGSGYPENLANTDIPLVARILAIADVYEALTAERPYRSPMPHYEVVEYIKSLRGTQFDPTMVDVFLRCESEFASI